MTPRRGAWLLAAGRTALGAVILIAPEQVTSHWLGEANARLAVVGDLARGLAVRDLSLGLTTLMTLDDPVLGPRVQFLCALADSVDALATALARAELPRKGVVGTVAIAGASAGAGFYFSHRLAHA
jgi:hypothetical protein